MSSRTPRYLFFLCAIVVIGCNQAGSTPSGPAGVELVANGGFEQPGQPADAWTQDLQKTGDKGQVMRDRAKPRTGEASLQLQPNEHNDEQAPLSVTQVISAEAYRGGKLQFSGDMVAEGGAVPIIGMLSIVRGQPKGLQMITHTQSTWERKQGFYEVPDDPSVQLALICMVNGRSGAAWFDNLSVSLPGAPPAAEPAESTPEQDRADATPLTAFVRVDAADVIRRIPLTLFGTNIEWRWNANLLWQEEAARPDPRMVELTRDLGVTLIRYPGGVYSDYYHWRDGIGPFDKRPVVKHEPGKDEQSRPNFGTDEALAFARQVGAELMITVNAGSGTAEEAADWVRYVNKDGLRVKYWEVGNELYINDGSVFASTVTMDPDTYADRYLKFARVMRQADPRIKIGAIGGENQGRYAIVSYPGWNRTVLEKAGSQIDYLSVHNGYAPVVLDDRQDLRTVYRAMFAAPTLFRRNLQTLARQLKTHAPDRDIPIAVTEWGPFFQVDFKSRYVDHNKTLGSALFTASAFKVLLESPQTQIANFWLLNDVSVLGWIGSRSKAFPAKPDWAPTARYFALQLYRRHFGQILVKSTSTGPTYDSEAVGFVEPVEGVGFLDVVSSTGEDGQRLYIMGINKHFDRPIDASINIRGFTPESNGIAWTLNGKSIDANTGTVVIDVPGLGLAKQAKDSHNPRFEHGGAGEITLTRSAVTDAGTGFTYRFPPHSVTSIVLKQVQAAK